MCCTAPPRANPDARVEKHEKKKSAEPHLCGLVSPGDHPALHFAAAASFAAFGQGSSVALLPPTTAPQTTEPRPSPYARGCTQRSIMVASDDMPEKSSGNDRKALQLLQVAKHQGQPFLVVVLAVTWRSRGIDTNIRVRRITEILLS